MIAQVASELQGIVISKEGDVEPGVGGHKDILGLVGIERIGLDAVAPHEVVVVGGLA